ncbi:endonuclease/exonuclease/phosphatase family protein [Cyclobacterium plantarum]|uniref:Endonuclease/exonuclease/phosphatase family protein n=1 Tax=Cyclobacterium plantarum TaxID=2716263 RepID=A0ABX0HHT6_9BACT|nr:endonuclease/exonuclease/phosphatase family protein [Cyclobacterium plantarum]NHE59615.1 endonuclease/exonuclease/phosphatase family protein [Cyclobacterium plantarum]
MSHKTIKILEEPPAAVLEEIAALNQVLDLELPFKKLDHNILIATWNIRTFGDLTEKWEAEPADSPKRDLHSLLAIAQIIARFDIIAIQEIKGNIKAFRHMLKVLGNHWSFILTDVSGGNKGNDERLGFLFDTRKVKLSGLACELVVPNETINGIKEGAFSRQFARTPYAVGFKVEDKTFVLVSMHVLYGKVISDRENELKAIAEWMKDWASNMQSFDQSLILLGDFNIDRMGDPRYEAFVSTGITVPEDLWHIRRTLIDNQTKFYSQIAWFENHFHIPQLSIKYVAGGVFDFGPHLLKTRALSPFQMSWRISDHLPLWAEFSTKS